MEIRIAMFVLCLGLFACSSQNEFSKEKISDLYVEDFESRETLPCTTEDVPYTHYKAREFFKRATFVDYKTLHDHYPIVSCYSMGVLKYDGKGCSWEIRAGATGSIQCIDAARTWYFACDDCDDLFKPPAGDKNIKESRGTWDKNTQS